MASSSTDLRRQATVERRALRAAFVFSWLIAGGCHRSPGASEQTTAVDASAADSATDGLVGKRPVQPGAEIDAHDELGQPLHFIVDTVEPNTEDKDGDVSFYGLRVKAPDGAYVTFCNPDAQGKSRAIPVKGTWDANGVAVPNSDHLVTFACTSGAIGKCIRIGYKPWKTFQGKSLAPYHAACVRMIRADYCGDGRPHTKDGTRIDIWDSLGIQKREEKKDEPEVFEAAWSPEGAAYLNVPRWADTPDDIVKECPAKLAKRSSIDNKLLLANVTAAFPEALVFNARYVKPDQRMMKKP